MYKIALISISGNISYENESILALDQLLNDCDEFQAFALWIVSGGGSLAVAHDLSTRILKSGIPSVAIIGELCASAAYYLALSTGRIVANPAALIGGLCASLEIAKYGNLHKKIGLQRITYGSGALKGMLSPYGELDISADEMSAIKDILSDLDSLFHNFLNERRPKSVDLGALHDGRLVSGVRALCLGLVDELGGIEEGIKYVCEELQSTEFEIVSIESDSTSNVDSQVSPINFLISHFNL